MAFRQIAARLGVARCALEGVEPAYHAATSTTQSRSVIELLKTATLTDTECADVMKLAVECKWCGSDGQVVADNILAKSNASFKKAASRKQESQMQDFTSFIDYLREADWKVLLQDAVGCDAKRDTVFYMLSSLGCRNMDEHTSKLLASLLLLLTRSWEACLAMDADGKAKYRKVLKSDFKRYVRGKSAPEPWLSSLPSNWAQLREKHTDMFSELYRDEMPVPCKADQQKLTNMNDSFMCRGSQSRALAMVTPSLQPQQSWAMSRNTVIG